MLDRKKLQSNSVLISKQMATSTKENQVVIVQEDQDEYFRDKMEEYKLFSERHPADCW